MVDHLRVKWDSKRGSFTVLERKQEQVREHARKFILESIRARRWVGRRSLRYFVGIVTALLPTISLALMHAHSLNDGVADLTRANMLAERPGERKRLTGRGLKDLK